LGVWRSFLGSLPVKRPPADGWAGGPGARSLAHARRRLLRVGLPGFVNRAAGALTLWQLRMGPTPGHPIRQPGGWVGAPGKADGGMSEWKLLLFL
jgi:hypothetical protein